MAVARNGDNVNAATSTASTAVYTLANIPSSVVASASGNAITVTFTGDATSYYVIDNSDSARYSAYTTTLSREFTGLTCATSYTFKVKGKNVADTETAYSSTASATTGACASSGGGAVGAAPAPLLPVSFPATPATVVSVIFSLNLPTSVTIGGTAHTVTVSAISASQITLIIQSEPIKLTLNKGQSQDIDTDKDSINDVRMTYLGLVSGKPKVELVNLTDTTEIKSAVSINAGAYETNTKAVSIRLNGDNIAQIAISNDTSFAGASFVPYVQTIKWNLTPGNGTKTVYVKFRSKDGGSTTSPDTIKLIDQTDEVNVIPIKEETIRGMDLVQSAPAKVVKYIFKTNKNLKLGSVGSEVKILQQVLKAWNYFSYSKFTTYFGSYTQSALKKYQKDNKLKATGNLDKATIENINARALKESSGFENGITDTTKGNSSYFFIRGIYTGTVSLEVNQLQTRLQELGYLSKDIKSNGVFGPSTVKAVIKLQKEHKLFPVTGHVGPKTRNILNKR